ncbi:MAG TPA: DUF4232 domain-containing protein [Amycolatopsis sp.]|uniref:DUF4232 domain-containing protein n=1 Tax=Amycolatopsis sp. TaxID=37632 RepID=UPI002F3E6D9F
MLGKRITIGVAAVAGAFALAACSSAAAAPRPAAAAPAAAKTPRCTTADLSLSLGKPAEKSDAPGQFDVPLTYKNVSNHTCGLYGVPGVDLVGPDDPTFGPVYHLPRVDNGVKYNEVTPGMTATATISVLTPAEGGKSWTPTKLNTIPPGQTRALTADWPSDLPVLRQDAATHPGTYVNGILADPS